MKSRLIVLTMMMLAASCGGADADAGSGVASIADELEIAQDTDGPVLDAETQLLAFAECVRDQGFEIGDPTVDSDGNVQIPRGSAPADGFAEARETCSENLDGVTLGFRGGDQTAQQDLFLEFASCMRDNGFDMPDPDSSSGGGRSLLRDVNQEDPTYQSAFANCDDILGAGRGN